VTDIKNANHAPRCRHIKLDDTPCRAPALHNRDFCRFHVSASDLRAPFPIIEDGLSLQAALMQVTRGILDGSLNHKTAALVLYAFQTMCSNLKRMNDERALTLKLAKKKDDDDDLPGPSLAEILLDRLNLMEAENAASQASAAPQDSVILSDAEPSRNEGSAESKGPVFPPRPPVSPAVNPDSGTIDKLEACAVMVAANAKAIDCSMASG